MRSITSRFLLVAVVGVLSICADARIADADTGSLVLVKSGEARSVVVTADEPSPVAEYAAEELVAHIEKATGARLEIARESDVPADDPRVRVYVGATDAARQVRLYPIALLDEAWRIKAAGGNLFILGREDGDELFIDGDRHDAIARDTRRGTFYGVTEFLERSLGVRWLWPGELGTYVPRRETLAVDADLDVTDAPAFRYRRYRIWRITAPVATGGYGSAVMDRMAFSEEGLHRYHDALRRYLLIHQEGDTEPKPRVGHRFQGWWGKYSEEHPEWFRMRDDGGRGPAPADPNTYQVRMCVSNPELQRFIVEQAWDGGDVLSLGEADHRGFCRCPDCKAWDEPQPTDFKGYSTSNRYVRFARAVHKLAVKRNPDVRIPMFLYMDYTHAPTIDADLSWMYGEFVPWGSGYASMYPMTQAQLKDIKRAWQGWSQTGMEMAYRPNYLLGGYVMPHLSTQQTGEMLRFAAEHGMVGFDYDSLWGHWATKGPMLYMHMRLGTNPSRRVVDVLDEYYSAFGPASRKVRAYFDYWEDYSSTEVPGNDLKWSNCSEVGELYPAAVFAPAEKLLEKALTLAQTSDLPEFAARVEFLQAGLEHAQLAARFAGLYRAQEFEDARQALLELVDFRRAHEQHFIADYAAAGWIENRTYEHLADLLEGNIPTPEPESAALEIGTGWSTPWGTWYFRKDPQDEGLSEADFAPETFDATGWTEVEVPSYLSATAAGPYNGYGWYAVSFELPADWSDEDIELLFEGVDKQVWVYVNGNLVYEHTVEATGMTVGELWATPFIARVPAEQVKAGGKNLLVVRIHSGFADSGLYKAVRLRRAVER